MVTREEAQLFLRRFAAGEFPHQRLGQAFVNHFNFACQHEAGDGSYCLFNERDTGAATRYIWSHLVKP